jgi:hypothetical protein
MSTDLGPTKRVDEWPLRGLSPIHRTKIKACLLKAHALYLRAPFDSFPYEKPMQQAFNTIAGILFDADLLTPEIVENQLRLFVVEAGIAGGWTSHNDSEPLTDIFPGFKGHRSAWEDFTSGGYLQSILAAEVSEWHGKLLERYAERSQNAPLSIPQQTPSVQTLAPLPDDPKSLRDSYRAEFPDAGIMDICWAAKQHYREWARWLKGDLKDGSKPDRAFRHVLTSGKTTDQLRREIRPKNWK